jgi:hypothetical protein
LISIDENSNLSSITPDDDDSTNYVLTLDTVNLIYSLNFDSTFSNCSKDPAVPFPMELDTEAQGYVIYEAELISFTSTACDATEILVLPEFFNLEPSWESLMSIELSLIDTDIHPGAYTI